MDNKLYKFKHRTGRNIQVSFYHIPGKEFSTGTKDETEAVLWAEKYLEKNGILSQEVKNKTIGEFCKNFFSRRDDTSYYYRLKRLHIEREPLYWTNSQLYLDNYIIPAFGDCCFDTLTPRGIENWLIDLQGVRKKELSAGSKIKILQCFRTILDEAVHLEIIQSNPANKVTAPRDEIKADEETEKELNKRRALTVYEQETLMPDNPLKRVVIWDSLMWASFFSVLYDTGFRPGEVISLRVCDIYTTPQGYAVLSAKSYDSSFRKVKNRVKTSGSGMSKRVALLSKTTGMLIEELISHEKIEKEEEYLFLLDRNKKDSLLGTFTTNKHFKSVLKKMNVEEAVEYSLRHTFATYKIGSVEERALALAMGHTGGKVREDYDHRTASILIGQLEKHREEFFDKEEKEDDIQSIQIKKRG